MHSLALANTTRMWRADLRLELKAMTYEEGCLRVATLLVDLPRELYTMTTPRLLGMVYRFGRSRTVKALRVVGISEHRQLGNLTMRQLHELAAWLTVQADA